MKRIALTLAIALLSSPALGGWANVYSGSRPTILLSELPAANLHNGETWEITNGDSTTDCDPSGTGAFNVRCISNGTTWTADPVIEDKDRFSAKLSNRLVTGICSAGVGWRSATCEGSVGGITYLSLGVCDAGEVAGASVTASTISFTASTLTIADSGSGFGIFRDGGLVTISGATNAENNGLKGPTYELAAGSFTIPEGQIVDETAGASITISRGPAPLPQQLCNAARLADDKCRAEWLGDWTPKWADCEAVSNAWLKDYLLTQGESGLDLWEASEPIPPSALGGVVEE